MRMKRRRRSVSFWNHWIPLLCWMTVIFLMSAQPHEKQDLKPWLQNSKAEQVVKERFSGVQLNYGGKEISVHKNGAAAFMEFFIRKLAHIMEYMVLGFLVFRLSARIIHRKAKVHMVLSLLFCGIYAGLDEMHQIYTAGRTPMISDVILDTCGAAFGIMTYYLCKQMIEGSGDTV